MRTAPRPVPRLTAGPRHMQGLARPAIALATTLMLAPGAATAQARTALPEEGRVVAGQATVVRQDQTLTVTQHTRRAVLEWHSFDIGADATVRFVQPSSASVTLNRVLGGDPSRIAGRLQANGHVYLVNPAGVLFAPGARVDVGQLLTSRVDIDTRRFMDGDDAIDTSASARPDTMPPPAQHGATPPPLRVEDPAPGEDTAAQPPPEDEAPAGLLTLAAGVRGHLRIGLEPEQVQALIDDGGLQEDGQDLVLSDEGSSALASSAVAADEAPQARGVAVRNGRLLLVAGTGQPGRSAAPASRKATGPGQPGPGP